MKNESNKIKVMHVLTDKNIGGAGRWLLYYLKYFNKDEFEVQVVLPDDSLLAEEVEKTGVPLIRAENMTDSSYDKKSVEPLAKIIKNNKPDIVHTHASLSARMGAKRAGVKIVISTKHCMEEISHSFFKRRLKGLINRYYSTKIIAVSDAVAKSLELGGTSAKMIVTVKNGVEPLRELESEEKKSVRRKFGLEEESFLIGILARLEEVKDHSTFFKMVKCILDYRQDVYFVVAGTGSLEDKLKEEAQSLGIMDKLHFTGFIKEIEMLTASLDLNVITSKQEALCLSIIEGMSAGVPAAGTACGGVCEVISPGRNGELAPPGDYKALAEKIEALIGDKEKYAVYSQNARKTVKEQFLASDMTVQIESLYKYCLSMSKKN